MGKLMKSFNKSKRGKAALIADVDCTTEGKPLCEKNGVQGFPTIKWGDPNALETYEGGRDYEALKKFAMENLKPLCSPANLDLCSDEKKAEIVALQALPDDELNKKIEEKEAEIKTAEETFEAEVKKLQETYSELQKSQGRYCEGCEGVWSRTYEVCAGGYKERQGRALSSCFN